MHAKKRLYLKILKVELEDLRMDIEQLIDESKKEKQDGELPECVVTANLSLFKNELLGVKSFEHIIDHIHPDDYESLDEMVDYLKQEFRKQIKTAGFAEAVAIYIDRKLNKVARYVED